MQPSLHDEFGNHKDRPTAETIATVKNILRSVGIGDKTPMSERYFNPVEGCHSVRITDLSYPALGSNGKGVTDEYSQASAYAEFIERLQCLYSYLFKCAGEISTPERMFHDEEEVPVADLLRDIPEIMQETVAKPEALPVDTLTCLPFWDVAQGETRMLPYNLLLLVTLSTGMCSGNTAEESLTQGICEVMERYASGLAIKGKLRAPTIPLEDLPLSAPGLRHIIEALHARGLKLVVKDCTMGGTIPVLAAFVIDEANDRFNLCYGSDPVFDVALQRCITELYQGRQELPHSYSYWLNGPQPPKDYFNNVHSSLKQLMAPAPPAAYRDAFAIPDLSNREYLAFVLERVHAAGGAVYVRDFSFLGFPSHYVYIQGMSSPAPAPAQESRFYLKDLDEAMSTLFRIHKAGTADVRRLARMFAEKVNGETIFTRVLVRSMNNFFARAPVVQGIEPRSFLSFLFLEAERPDEVIRILQEPRGQHEAPPEMKFWPILLDYSRLLKSGASPEEALAKLSDTHCENPYGQSLPHLVNQQWASFYLREPADTQGRKFEGLPIPRCDSPFSCFGCAFNGKCMLKRFFEVRAKIKNTYKPIDQARLGAVLSNNPASRNA